MPFKKIEPEKLSNAVVRQVELLIMRGILKPGERLPSERELAEQMGVSRPSLREAIANLQERGLLATRAGAGIYVAEVVGAAFSDALVQLFADHDEAVFDYISFRRDLEGLAAERAARLGSDTDLKVVDTIFRKMEAAHTKRNPAEEAQLDAEFHLAIIEASHNVIMLHFRDFGARGAGLMGPEPRLLLYRCATRKGIARLVVTRRLLHLQMQPIASERVLRRQLQVQLNPQTRLLGRRDKSVLHSDRPADQVAVELRLNGLAHQQIRQGRRQMNVGRPLHRPGIEMRRKLCVEHLCQPSQLLHLPNPARATQRRLQDFDPARTQQRGELRLGGQSLARRNGGTHGAGNFGKFQRVVGRQRFLEPQRLIRLNRAPQPDRAGGVELPMGAKQQVRPVAHGLPDRLAERDRHRDIEHRRLMPRMDRIRPRRVKLDGGVATIHGI